MPVPPPGAEAEAWITLDLIPGLGGESFRKLLHAFSSPATIVDLSASQLSQIVSPKVADAIAAGPDKDKLQATLKWLSHEGNHLLTLADEDYPRQLLEIADPPPLLYLKGRRELLGRPGVAIVGSRNATPTGVQNAEAFAKALSHAGLLIISGMALGIDGAAHRGGLSGGASSIAVVGTGLDLIYPARNKPLAQALATDGLIISEFSLGTPALARNFPRRNRIISGLSKGVLVVEAALSSGSLITARQAAEQGREVFAIPGSIHSPFSKGCHQLIKQGAKLVDDASDILVELRWSVVPAPTPQPCDLPDDDDPMLQAMGYDPVSIDTLIERTQLPVETIMVRLTEGEITGLISVLPGGRYQRMR
ncbi:MAG: DNA-protecting protein DprA [Betaproteobacteria bacterium]|nr:DNA-protecting protein DprA [Betaproteobacteria bacterium]